MEKSLCIVAQKGGCGKSTTAQAIGLIWAYKAKKGQRGLWVDLDPQGNLTDSLGVDDPARGSFEVMAGQCRAEAAIINVSKEMDLLPATDGLIQGETTLLGKKNASQLLAKALAPILDRYDFIILDTPPSLGLLTLNGLMAAGSCLIPAHAERFSLKAVVATLETVEAVRKTHPVKVEGILVTRFLPRQRIAQAAMEAIKGEAAKRGVKVFKTAIRDSAAIREAQACREDIIHFDRAANASLDYASFYKELLKG